MGLHQLGRRAERDGIFFGEDVDFIMEHVDLSYKKFQIYHSSFRGVFVASNFTFILGKFLVLGSSPWDSWGEPTATQRSVKMIFLWGESFS